MKRLLLFIILFIALSLNAQGPWDGTSSAWTRGDGSENDPWQIETAQHLAHLATTTNSGNSYEGKYFKLMNDLDLGGSPEDEPRQNWTPIGRDLKTSFKGYFDGYGNTMANMYVSIGGENVGLFGCVNNCEIKDVGIIGSSEIVGTGSGVGGIVGGAFESTIINCYNTGSVSGERSVGVIVGGAFESTIINCYNTGSVSGGECVGGIVGFAREAPITNCYNTGSVSGGELVGGIVGGGTREATITNCYNTGNVFGENLVGGIVGDAREAPITNCYNTGNVSGKSFGNRVSVGGISGVVSTVTNCYKLADKVTVNGQPHEGTYYGLLKTDSEMKSSAFVFAINNSQHPQTWFVDYGLVNNGYPIFSYQSTNSEMVTVTIEDSDYGTMQLFDSYGEEIISGGEVIAGSIVRIVTNATDGYITGGFLVNDIDTRDAVCLVMTNTTISAKFSLPSDIYDAWCGGCIPWDIGTGDPATPYLIYTPENLAYLAKMVNSVDSYEGKYFKLMNGLDLGGSPEDELRQNWTPIGRDWEMSFKGYFDGDGNSISNMYASIYGDGVGLFGYVSDCEIKGVGIVGSSEVVGIVDSSEVIVISDGVGGIAGSASNSAIINCYNTGNVSIDINVGGIVGSASNCSIINCYNTGNVSGDRYTGGIVGSTSNSAIINCYNMGNVFGYSYVGGIVGGVYFSSPVINCYNAGNVSGSSYVGGIVGEAYSSPIPNCYKLSTKVTVDGSAGDGNEYGDVKTEDEMKAVAFVTLLNSDEQTPLPWLADNAPNVNGGYPILSYQETFVITVVAGDNGAVDGGGIYYVSSTATLTATADTGYSFLQWHDGNIDNPRRVVVASSATYTAEFVINEYDVAVEGYHGTVVGGGTYNYGSTIVLAAVADANYHFVKWSDGVTDNPRTVTVTSSASYTAEFVIDKYEIVVTAGTGGTVTGGGLFDYNSSATITATADTGYSFLKWSDGNSDNPRTVTVTSTSTYIAEFDVNKYDVTVVGDHGTVIGGGTYSHGTIITLAAVADANYHFVKWSDGVTDNPRTVTVTSSAIYTADFSANKYEVRVTAGTGGTVTGGGSFDYNTNITITATADTGYSFVKWSDGNSDNPRTITVASHAVYTAEFVINSYTITVNGEHGVVVGGGTYNHGSTVTLVAISDSDYMFLQWSDGNVDNPRIETVLSDATYTAEFKSLIGVADVDDITLQLYPNPIREVLNVEGEYSSLSIYNSLGCVVLTSYGESKLDVSALPNGLYIVRAYNGDKVVTYKIVK